MSGKIPKHFIQEMLSKTNIVELIQSKINLKKCGKNYQTHCPFHDDKTPSFTVSNEKQFYYCFGCHAYGNVIDFLIKYDNLNFVESIEELANMHNVSIPFENVKNNLLYQHKQKLYDLTNTLSQLYQKNIKNNNLAYKYLLKRGITQNMIDFFSIGFSSFQWSNFCRNNYITKKFEKTLLNYGIISIHKKGYIYDRFQGRVVFPIQDYNGKVIGFGGRTINDAEPKYINSPETNIFHKRKQIYGLYQVKKKCFFPEYLIVVEGFIDVITLTQYNIYYAVSSLGTSTTSEHIKTLFKHTDTVIYCYDGDHAGRSASWTTLKKALPYITDKKKIKFIFLPKNEDPDTIIRKEGKKEFEKRINNAVSMSKFFFQNILKNMNLSSVDDKFSLSVRALPLINTISSDTIRIYLRQILGRMIGILDDDQFEKFLYEKEIKKNEKTSFQIKRTPMRTLIGLLIQNPDLSAIAPTLIHVQYLHLKGFSIFLDLLKTCLKNPGINTIQLLELYRHSKIINILKILAKWDHMIVKEEIHNMFLDLLKDIHYKNLEKKQEYLISKERLKGLTMKEKKEIWSINKILSKK